MAVKEVYLTSETDIRKRIAYIQAEIRKMTPYSVGATKFGLKDPYAEKLLELSREMGQLTVRLQRMRNGTGMVDEVIKM